MTPAEREAIRAAACEAAKDAPPLRDEQIEMLRRDGFPFRQRAGQKAAS